MHVLLSLGIFVVLLYWWLIGHWFARVLVFLVLACLSALLSAGNGAAIIGAGVIAWFVSGIPVYWHRYQQHAPQQWRPWRP